MQFVYVTATNPCLMSLSYLEFNLMDFHIDLLFNVQIVCVVAYREPLFPHQKSPIVSYFIFPLPVTNIYLFLIILSLFDFSLVELALIIFEAELSSLIIIFVKINHYNSQNKKLSTFFIIQKRNFDIFMFNKFY